MNFALLISIIAPICVGLGVLVFKYNKAYKSLEQYLYGLLFMCLSFIIGWLFCCKYYELKISLVIYQLLFSFLFLILYLLLLKLIRYLEKRQKAIIEW